MRPARPLPDDDAGRGPSERAPGDDARTPWWRWPARLVAIVGDAAWDAGARDPAPPAPRRAALTVALLFLGAAAVAAAAAAIAGTLRVDEAPLGPVRETALRLLFGACVVPAGLVYLRLHRRTDAPLGALLAGALAIHLAAFAALPFTSNDVFSNLAYGHLHALGANPYTTVPSALPPGDAFRAMVGDRWSATPIVYGPLLVWMCALAGRATDVVTALVAFKLEALATSLALVLVAYGFCRRQLAPRDPAGAARAFVLVAWNPLLLWEVSAQAHNDGVMLVGLAGFAWAAVEERALVATLCLAVAFYAKFAVAPVIGLYLVYLARRSPLRALALAALVPAVGVLLFAPLWAGRATLAGPLGALLADPDRTTRSFINIAVAAAAPLGEPIRRGLFRVLSLAGTALLLAVAARAVLRARTLEDVLRDSLLFLFLYMALTSPWSLAWYGTWLLPLALATRDPRWARLAAVYTALLAAQYLVPLGFLMAPLAHLVALSLYLRRVRQPASVDA